MHRLQGVVQRYPWGSRTAIPELVGVDGDGEPWAELWYGAHASAPARLPDGRTLDAAIAADPIAWLGADVVERFGPRLPFLVKLLAAAEPLSLQAHPSAAQAVAGFAREDEHGVPRDALDRIYRDPHHKPELLCALSPFDALCGFRPLDGTVELLRSVAGRGARGLKPFADLLAGATPTDAPAALAYTVSALLTMPSGDQRHLVDETAAACAGDDSPWSLSTSWTVRLAERFGGDVSAVVALLLHCVRLQPGQAIYLGAGNLHAYLRGTGVEVMANSDNVVRGGLTTKHVDVRELLDVLDTSPIETPVIEPVAGGDGVLRYATPAPEFAVSVVQGAHAATVSGPELLACTAGSFAGLPRGAAALVAASERRWSLAGDGTAYAIGVGDAVSA